jgi:hypothetical protein
MKNIFIKFVMTTILFSSLNAQAGKIKDIVIDTDEAITEELQIRGEGLVESIYNHQFVTYEEGVAVQATASNEMTEWTCIVYFKKIGDNYSPVQVSCE